MEVEIKLRYVSCEQAALGAALQVSSASNSEGHEVELIGQTQSRTAAGQGQEAEILLIAGTVQLDDGDGD